MEGLLHAFSYANKHLCSERMVKRIHYMLKLTMELQESTREPIVLPAPDRILNFQQRIKPKAQILSPVGYKAKDKKGEDHSFCMNEPSKDLKHLAVAPDMVNQMSALPGFTAGLTEVISRFWFENHSSNKFKRILPGSSNTKKYLKMVLAPIFLWSDDTSDNKSKQYNVFYGYLMYMAAMPLEMKSRRENTLFICISDKNLKAFDMLGPIVDDFVKLEIGIEVFSYDHNEYVLLVVPLLLLIADNSRHSQLAMHKGTNSKELTHLHDVIQSKLPNAARYKILTDTLSFSVNGSEEFLRLNSFDLTKDCPVEVLHTVPLGCIKYLVDYFMKEVLTVAERDTLGNIIMPSRNRNAYSRIFRNNLRHCGSFVGRDYKQLIQVLPTIISKLFLQSTVRINMFSQCFIYLGQLCSLIYLRGIESNYEQYIYVFRDTLSNFTDSLYVLDKHLCQTDAKSPKFSLRPKIHLLHHLLDDVQRF
ncbi:hypothetical protein PHYBLDRAFT_145311 [Phycomyces blakesleeanus NRRL 1555(-)]|uniref:Uncharacterized protein n=1 Tax=Phycomyces blakesleeanus (strain ATCC 8743b / DSM 1359 / FGSC 10004 / NBRC 33097 / NRRL 1555) TaxID=763407 RepID=A0A163DWJ9_PHYB8|nr:hypothetical protein PHYBLDRAFT_145311 [Phycomyces blakesleeanus NRRL 1555(-)]OAD73840.1 hypothetical protein PHYBLDRAFT_145311 [Phycomyces blakesleeanus NRRL 1555(-)]|eukprot:XP_018291880.1 hypothetical protein PHYBLDRAFT_145311 [Phycomyces blakesleeanus NRRL 1555(-)]